MPFLLNVLFLFLFFIAIFTIFISKNWRNHLVLLFCLFIYLFYLYLTPNYYASINDFAKFNNDFSNYFDQGVWIYFFSLLSFLLGYFLVNFFDGKFHILNTLDSETVKFNYRKFDWLFYIILGLNLITLSDKGISFDVFMNPSRGELSLESTDAGSYNPYILFFSDSLITLLIAAYLFKVNRKKLFVWVLISFFVFLVLGFRYRILLTLAGILIIYFFQNKVNAKKLIYYPFLFLTITYIIVFITNNRKEFTQLKFNELKFGWNGEQKEDFPGVIKNKQVPLVYAQTNNFSTDFSALKAFELGMAEHDYGRSMIVFIFIRLTPSAFFEGGVKPPIPQQVILKECFGSDEGLDAGAAVTNIYEYYIAFGEIGSYLLMFIFGGSIAWLSRKVNFKDKLSVLKYVILTVICFQIITRGYTPQTVNHLAYMLIPYFLIKKWIYEKGDVQRIS